jgi:C4-type Zn-finger protein
MGLFNSIKDHFNKAEFTIAPNKKLKTISKEFKEAFGLCLVFYKGKMIAEDTLTLSALNNKTSKDVATSSKDGLKLKASMKVGDAEKMFDTLYGVTVQIKDKSGKSLIDNNLTIGDGSRQ